ncbi:MAG: biotin transporter BioY [Eubacteriales bacterium]|nr:biotin transporter BioY [Eubacteriales bacterium]
MSGGFLRTEKKKTIQARELVRCGMFSALIAAGAFLRLDLPVQPFPMHFTLQFFFVLLGAFLMGPREGMYSVGIYLLVGLSGVPVFAAGGGPAYLIRPTFGFLLGFLLAAGAAGALLRLRRNPGLFWYLVSALCGMALMYAAGILYFYLISNYVIGMPVSWGVVLVNCGVLTVGGDAVLCLLAALLARRLRAAGGF